MGQREDMKRIEGSTREEDRGTKCTGTELTDTNKTKSQQEERKQRARNKMRDEG